VITAVTTYYVHCIALRLLSPLSIKKTYSAAISRHLRTEHAAGYEVFSLAVNSFDAKEVFTGLSNMYYRIFPEAESLKIPFAPDLAEKAVELMQQGTVGAGMPDLEIDRADLVMAVGICFLLRMSEHMGSNKKGALAKALTRGDIFLYDRFGQLIDYPSIGKGTEAKRVVISIPYSKKDGHGRGRINSFERQPEDESFCVVKKLEKWIARTRDDPLIKAKQTDDLYDIPDRGHRGDYTVKLTAKALSDIMTETTNVTLNDGKKKRVCTHSLRYGGATAMAARGLPQYLIAIYGGWSENSKSLRNYIGVSQTAVKEVSAAMAHAAKNNASQPFIEKAIIIARQSPTGGRKRVLQ
jgi:hypothetical protein